MNEQKSVEESVRQSRDVNEKAQKMKDQLVKMQFYTGTFNTRYFNSSNIKLPLFIMTPPAKLQIFHKPIVEHQDLLSEFKK